MNLWEKATDKLKAIYSYFQPLNTKVENKVIKQNYKKAERSELFLLLKSRNEDRVLEYLENGGVDVEEVDLISGLTPLLYAIKHRQWYVTEKLLELGADVNFIPVNSFDFTVTLAFRGKNYILVKQLIEKGMPVIPVDPSFSYVIQAQPICLGVMSDNLIMTRWLLERVVAEEIKEPSDQWGFENTMGESIGFAKSKEMIELLLEFGAKINYCCSYVGKTPLTRLVERQENELAVFLLNKGANPNTPYIG